MIEYLVIYETCSKLKLYKILHSPYFITGSDCSSKNNVMNE